MSTVQIAKVAIKDRGFWAADTVYEELDSVKVQDTGNVYIALAQNENIIPGTDDTKWALAVSSGPVGSSAIKHKITYASSETSVSNIAWDTIHVFPEMASLSLTFSEAPSDGNDHEMVIVFTTPGDLSDFSLSLDSDVIWAGIALPANLLPSTTYEICINASDMIATYIAAQGSSTPRRFETIEEVALPVGASYKILELSEVPHEMVSYSSSDPLKLTVDRNGIVKGISTGTAVVSVYLGSTTKNITFHIGQEVVDTSGIPSQDRVIDEVVITNPRSILEEGDEYALFAIGISNSLAPRYDIGYYNPIKFSSSDPSVATVQFGTLMAVGQGTCTITASDLNDNASTSFQLTVTAKQTPSATVQQTYIPEIDNTGATDVTVAMAEAFAYAAEHNYKKISFPQGTYLMNGDNRPNGEPIQFPSDMIIDFNGSEIVFDDSSTAVTNGYTMFYIFDAENVWLRNLTILAENYNRTQKITVEQNRCLSIKGASKNIHIENCTFAYSPGFNVSIDSVRNTFYPGQTPTADFSTFRLANMEAGGYDSTGNPVEASATFRAIDYIDVNSKTNGWVFGNPEGYQTQYIRSRIYDIYFFDENHDFMYRKQNCYQYQRYEFESLTKPRYCKIAFFQESAPTDGYDSTKNMAWIYDRHNPEDVYFKNCLFTHAISTGLSPQGGEHIVVDGCTFIDNGYQDPYSHIDWEDGRSNSQGHIVRNCVFSLDELNSTYGGHYVNGQVINGFCTNITIHDCLLEKCYFRTGTSSYGSRTFHNTFKGDAPSLTASDESVFAGNFLDKQPTFPDTWYRAKYIDVDNEVVT